jgi:glycosyltransferase involved in cell wall biosynthesis
MIRLAIITTHPIQYNAPMFKLLAMQPGLEIKVFYTLGKDYASLKDKGFGEAISWDIPLLEGYACEFLENTSLKPGTSHIKGVINPDIIASVEAFKPSAILVFGWSFVSHLKVLRYFKGKLPVYFRGDSTLLDEQKNFKVLFRRLALKWVYTYIDKTFYVGTKNKEYFLKHGLREHNLVFVPHAIDNKRFGNNTLYEKEVEAIRAALGVPKQHTLFLFSGKFEQKKSPLLLLRAFKKLTLKNVSLLFVGNGVLENLLKEEAQGQTNIYFLPFQNQAQMPAVYRSANVYVLPSGGPGETWGLAVNEAMACGLPVIVSNKVGCAVDLVQNNKNGFIFESGNLESLVEKLSLCAAMPKAELHDMGSASKEFIQDWSFEHVCDAIVMELMSLKVGEKKSSLL